MFQCRFLSLCRFQETVMFLTHQSILIGNMDTIRTVNRVLFEFYWPRVQSSVKKFSQSCDKYHCMVSKSSRVAEILCSRCRWLMNHFKGVAVNLIGLLHPIKDRDNRCILTLVDFATIYPEAEALPIIKTDCVAEA